MTDSLGMNPTLSRLSVFALALAPALLGAVYLDAGPTMPPPGWADPSMDEPVPFLTQQATPEMGRFAILLTFEAALVHENDCVLAVQPGGPSALLSLPEPGTYWHADSRTIRMARAEQVVGEGGVMTFSGQVVEALPDTTDDETAARLAACGVRHVALADGLGFRWPEPVAQGPYVPPVQPDIHVTYQHPLRRDRVRPEQLCTVGDYPHGVGGAFDSHGLIDSGRAEVFYASLAGLSCAPDGAATVCETPGGYFPLVIRSAAGNRAVRPRSNAPLRVRIEAGEPRCEPAELPEGAYDHPPLKIVTDNAFTVEARPDGSVPERELVMWRARGAIRDDGCLMLRGEDGMERAAVFSDQLRLDPRSLRLEARFSTIIGDASFGGEPVDWRGEARSIAAMEAVCGTARAFVMPRLMTGWH